MTEPAKIATPCNLTKAEEVIAEYVQKYGFTRAASRYFGRKDSGWRESVALFDCPPEVDSGDNSMERAEWPSGQASEVERRQEKDELHRLRSELKKMREERDLLAKAATWFARNEVP